MADRVLDAMLASVWLLAELAVLFLVVATAVAVAARRLGVHRLRRLLGGGRVTAAFKGIVLGFVTPFCTYSAIPVLVAMLDAGVRTSAWVGFLLAAPVLDPLIFVAIAVIFGPLAAVLYTVATFTGALTAALVADVMAVRARRPDVRAHRLTPTPGRPGGNDPACGPDPFASGRGWQGWPLEVHDGVRYALGLIRGMALPLGVAAAIAAVIAGLVPRDLLVAVAGPDNPFAVPVAALVGTPLYVSGEAFLPIAAALRDQGMSDGAVFALIIAGAGVNVPELALLGTVLPRRVLAGVAAAIFIVAVVTGYAIPALT